MATGPVQIRVDFNGGAFASMLQETAEQMPFATALALTKTAQLAQADVRAQLSESFTLRNSWVSKGIRILPARKDDLAATVYTKDYFMALHVMGGDRVPASPGKDAVPVGARANKRDFTRKKYWAGKLLAKGGRGFKAKLKNGAIGVFVRKAKGKDKGKISLYWVLKRAIKIKADWPFEKQWRASASRNLPEQINLAMRRAVETAWKRHPPNSKVPPLQF